MAKGGVWVAAGVLLAAWTAMAQGVPAVAETTTGETKMTEAAEPRDTLGRSVKLRMLVDKVVMKRLKPATHVHETELREIADAGFNVVVPRWGAENPDEVRRVAAAAQPLGLYYLPFMRGTQVATGDVRMVWANGFEQEIASPCADELWDWLREQITGYAKTSLEHPALAGVFLDFENYSPRPGLEDEWQCYPFSYDREIVGKFAASRGRTLPEKPPVEGGWHSWLEAQGLEEAFASFQIVHWRERCRQLRRAVDAVNPAFQFCVYPSSGSPFIESAVYVEWGTPAAPLILADRCIYGRSRIWHRESLEGNREKLRRRQAEARARNLPNLRYMGGIDPMTKGADPEFSGRNAAMSACETDGYWVFYEGPAYGRPDHHDYWRWFTRANQAIMRGEAQAFADAERETADPGAEGHVKP